MARGPEVDVSAWPDAFNRVNTLLDVFMETPPKKQLNTTSSPSVDILNFAYEFFLETMLVGNCDGVVPLDTLTRNAEVPSTAISTKTPFKGTKKP